MTEPGPPHLDLDALADALAGEAAADAEAHLAGCASCTSRLAELMAAEARVIATLAALPDPPLPVGLAERLSAAFAAEPAHGAVRTNVTALPERVPRRRFLSAAAAVLLVSAGGLGYTLVKAPGGGDEAADTAAGASVPALVLNSSGLDYADPAAVRGALPSLLAGNAEMLLSADAATAQAPSDVSATTGGTGGGDVSRSAGEELTVQAPAADPLARLRTPEGLDDCLAGVLPPEEPDLRPRALDYAQYQGQPALAVLLPDPDPAKVSVFVVGPDCTAADAKVLGFFRIDAP